MYISAIAFSLFMLDRVTKGYFYASLTPGQSIPVVPNIFHMTLVLNDGAAFGIFGGLNSLFKVFSLAAVAAIIYFAWKHEEKGYMIYTALALILGGAIGNLVDRVVYGFIIDFIDLRVWPVFNIADSAITAGFLILAFNIIASGKKV